MTNMIGAGAGFAQCGELPSVAGAQKGQAEEQ